MKNILRRRVATIALGAASLSLAAGALAQTYSTPIGPSNQAVFSNGTVTGTVVTGIRSSRMTTMTGPTNTYQAAVGTQCFNEQPIILGGTYVGKRTTSNPIGEYFCQGNNTLFLSKGGLLDVPN